MKKILLLILCVVLFSCERRDLIPETPGTISFTSVESDYEVDENQIYSWIKINGNTYYATCSNIEPVEATMCDELAFIDMSSWISMISTTLSETVEILEEETIDNITYRKYKSCIPVSYNGFNFKVYFIEERAFVTVDNNMYQFPAPVISAEIVNNKKTRQSDMSLNGKTYSCYLIDITLDIYCAPKTIAGQTCFLALDEKDS